MHYHLLALDLDGTTVGRDLTVAPDTIAAVAAFQSRGGWVSLATGRNVRTTAIFAEQLGVNGPLICYQGALIKDRRSGEILFHDPVPPDRAAEAVSQLLGAGVYVHAYIDDELYVPWSGREVELYQSFSQVKLVVHVVDDLAAVVAQHPPTKLLFIDEQDKVGPRVAGLQTHFVDRLHVVRSHAHFGELTAPGCTKGRALAQLAARLHIPQQQVAAAGDQFNDLEMLTWAGLGMAVRSAPPEVLAVAQVLIDEPEQAGVAAAIRRYLLADEAAAQHRRRDD
ncbi:MAG TPA: Cof-type HAD-IIB family hydrolase [Herpetosiphonaceae bacterium]